MEEQSNMDYNHESDSEDDSLSDISNFTDSSTTVSERFQCNYSDDEKGEINDKKIEFDAQIRRGRRGLKTSPKFETFENQDSTGQLVAQAFLNLALVLALVVADTQVGKTGCMLALIIEFVTNQGLLIPIDNIYIITGLSSKDWKKQTKNRFPDILKDNIYHNSELAKFKKDIQDKKIF